MENTKNKLTPSELDLSFKPLPGSKKVYLKGTLFDDVKVPVREISQSATKTIDGEVENPSLQVYDTSGIYTDPSANIQIDKGLPELRQQWIEGRGDVEQLETSSSAFRREREAYT